MQGPTDFKLLLEQNKIHTPFFLRLLFKPLYQLSFIRYRVLNYFFKNDFIVIFFYISVNKLL